MRTIRCWICGRAFKSLGLDERLCDGCKLGNQDKLNALGGLYEKDPTGKSAHEMGAKLDEGKAPLWQGAIDYFPRALVAVAEVSKHGATKYAWKSWEQVPNARTRYLDALVRHLLQIAIGEETDKDSGLEHLAHIAWNALAVLEMKKWQPK